MGRIGTRGRKEEGSIDIDWLRKYQGYYDRALFRDKINQPIVIDGEPTSVIERGKWVDQILSICGEILGVSSGCDKNDNVADNSEQDERHEMDDTAPVKGDIKMSIKVRYKSRICRVGNEDGNLSQIRAEVKRKWPEMEEESVGFTWKKVKGGPWCSITTEEELREALGIMSTQGRPVARLVVSERDNKGHYQEVDTSYDS